ncbi:MAG: glycoside hydrolase family 127 protein [Bacteroidales bacterium]|nr:glycoside hydrolase family 127 protein [Bacteroidales bacterium]
MKAFKILAGIILPSLILSVSCQKQESGTAEYPVMPVPFNKVALSDDFWLPRLVINSEVTIPIAFCQSEETGRIRNFEIAGGLAEGSFCSKYGFDDSDVYKIIEGASYSLMIRPDTLLEAYLDSLICKIALAQEDDGYLYTNRTIMGDSALPMAGSRRWEKVSEHSHELYNLGHLYEAAAAHYTATGKKSLLNVAMKSANLVNREFGWGRIERYPGHQEIEMGLVRLYRITRNRKYLDLAKFFLDVRGPGGWEYNQSHLRVTEQSEATGHAVRACYMYSGMADVAALTGDTSYIAAIGRIWEDVVTRKMYVTGGIGQTGSNEGFGAPYDLPNLTAYCETCASIAFVMWNQRMFLLHGDAGYIDVMERTLYNALLSGVSLTGDHFFYPNPLESDGGHQRREWFGCACCPSNICRFMPSIPGYVYAHDMDHIFVNLFIAGETTLETRHGMITLRQENSYPWEGDITIHVEPERTFRLDIWVRIPGWARNEPVPGDLYRFAPVPEEQPVLEVNGEKVTMDMLRGYARISRRWQSGDVISLTLPMPVREVLAHDSVAADRGAFAIQRGPLVYCLEDHDQDGATVMNLAAAGDRQYEIRFSPDMLNGVQTITFEAVEKPGEKGQPDRRIRATAIPYYAWANRGAGGMRVWVPY